MLGRIVGNIAHGIKTIGKYVSPVAKFIGKYHQHLAPVAHGLAMASGHEGLQKVTGAALALSNMASMRQNLDKSNNMVRNEMQRTGATTGIFDHHSGAKVG